MTDLAKIGIAPTEYKVLVRPDKVDEKTQGGIWKPQDLREKEQAAATTATIIDLSPLAFTYEEWPDGAVKPRKGDRVAFARYAGMTIKGKDGEEHRLINDRDVCA